MYFALINSIVLHYKREGKANGIPIVFINSLGTDLRIWDAIISSFAASYSIVRYDKRGHGLSDSPPPSYSIRDHSSDLTGLLDHLHIEKAIIVGISVGGMIALDFAYRHPARVKALILCDTAVKIGTENMWNERIQTLHQRGMEYLADTILAHWFTTSFRQQNSTAYRGYRNMFMRTPLEGYVGTCKAIRDADLTAQTQTIQTKALVLCGTEDASTPPDLVQGTANMLSHRHFQLIEGAGHLPCIEQPQLVVDNIKQFLKENNYA
jgi:3-oxoadipate enol-lactonase